ncbi:hypothetical protein FACS1894166_04130 [Bacilli bacterium]|nr:hypothetical protein FACS1894166_04130 [Bacilli bacterium]
MDAGLITMTTEGQVYDFFNDRIIIPIYDNNGYLAAFSGRTTKNVDPKYLNTSTTPIFSKANTLFNFYKAKQITTDKIIIVEGFMDAIAYVRAGYKNVVATMGVALSSEHLNALHTIPKLETVILSFDNDTAGVTATVEHGKKLMESGFNTFVVGPFDKKYKDVDEFINVQGNTAIGDILNNRLDFMTFLISDTFSTKKPVDEVQKDVNSILRYLVECADNSILLRTQHLKLLATKSGLEYEDLRDKFNHDLEKELSVPSKPASYDSYQTKIYKPIKPSNEIGLKETFVEEENKKVKQEINHQQLDELYCQRKVQIKKLSESYDSLIRNLIVSPDQIELALDELFIENEFHIDEQRFILKSIAVLHKRGMRINKESLLKYIDEQTKKESSVAKNYKRADVYLQNLLNDLTYKTFGKIMSINRTNRIKELLHLIQAGKYNLLITNKLIEV